MQERLLDLLERLGTAINEERRKQGRSLSLHPTHYRILFYLSQCNRYSNTPQALASYLGLTKGAVSQSLRVLQEKGLILVRLDDRDRRVHRLYLTQKGHQVLQGLYPDTLRRAVASLSPEQVRAGEEILRSLLRRWQASRAYRPFGVCKHCRFFLKKDGKCYCNLTGETLSPKDAELICYHFQGGGSG